MPKSIIELVTGDIIEKRFYRHFMKRVNALPKDYRFAFKKIQQYLYSFGTIDRDMTIFTDLLNLFELSAAEGKAVVTVIGSDAAAFCDELIRASAQNTATAHEQFNQEILKHFYGEGDVHDKHN